MKYSKKLVTVLAALSITAIAFTGCAGEDSKEKTTETTKTESTDVKDSGKTDREPVKAEKVEQKTVFVSPDWVQSVIDGQQEESENYVILEAAWGDEKESPDYTKGHIPGAIHVDIASVEGEPLWNLKSPEEIEKSMLDLGITKDKTVILYGPDVSGTARVAYAYLWAGVENVKVLNGGLDAWKKAGYDLQKESNKAEKAEDFGVKVPAHPEYWMSIDQVKEKLESDPNFKLVSIRSEDEFLGKTSGYTYIPKAGEPKGAVWGKGGSDPYSMEDYTNDDGTYITMEEMKELWKDLDFTDVNELSFYCGTGWRASIPFLIMYQNGYTNMSMYDGGWYEWQMDDSLPVQVGDPLKDDVEYSTVGELSDDKAAKE